MSSPALPTHPHDAISERAAEYFQKRQFWNWSEADQAELDAWLAESVLNRVAYLRVEGIAAHAGRLAARRPLKPSSDDDNQGIVRKILQRRFVLPLLAAASVGFAVTFGLPLLRTMMQPPDRTYATDIGGRTLLSFADHTQIELNTDTIVRYRMTNSERTVWLEKGEAWFRVAHNEAVPFAVIVGRHRVNDVGTEFLVRRGSDGMEVALLNGKATLSTEGAQTATLIPGDDALATSVGMVVTRRSPQELADRLAWQRGLLEFRNTPLTEVVREFNRYNTTKLVIADPSIADVKVSAELKTDDYEGFLQLAHAVLNLRVDREGNDILISREAQKKSKRAVHAKHAQ